METLTPYARQFLPTLPRPMSTHDGVPRPSRSSSGRARRRELHRRDGHGDRALPPPPLREGRRSAARSATPDRRRARRTFMFARSRSSEASARCMRPPSARKGTYLDVFTARHARLQTARVDGVIVTIDPPPKLAGGRSTSIDLASSTTARIGRPTAHVRSRAAVAVAATARVPRSADRAAAGRRESSFAVHRSRVQQVRDRHPRARSTLVLVQHEAGPVRGVRGHRLPGGLVTRREKRSRQTAAEVRRALGDRAHPGAMAARRRPSSAHDGSPARDAPRRSANAPRKRRTPRRSRRRPQRSSCVASGSSRSASVISALDAPPSRCRAARCSASPERASSAAASRGSLRPRRAHGIGLHLRDTEAPHRQPARADRDRSTVLVVEHDAEMIRGRSPDRLGPTGGRGGGHIARRRGNAHVRDSRSPASPTAQPPRAAERASEAPGTSACPIDHPRAPAPQPAT